MLVKKRITAVGLGLLLVIGSLLGALPAQADTAPAPPEAIVRAGDWVENDFLQNCTGGNSASYNCTNGGLADAILALAATENPKYGATLEQMSAQLEPQVAGYTNRRADATAKIIITVEALGMDPTNYGGINLVDQLNQQLAENGPGGFWGPSLAIMALYRTGQPIPDDLVDALAAMQDPESGGFGWQSGGAWNTDGDNTAVGMMAMYAASSTSATAAASYEKAVQWTNDPANLTTDDTGTYWDNYSPANTVGMMLSAIGDVNDPRIDATAQMDFLLNRQLSSGAFASTRDGQEDNAMATTQALMGLALNGYLTARAPAAEGLSFVDVGSGDMFYDEIMWLAGRGITTGWEMADGTRQFRPLEPIHRDAMAAFLYRMAGSPEFTPPEVSPFTDVPVTSQFYREITWLAAQGITTGWPDGSFRPLDSITRDAMAAFLYRMAGSPGFEAPGVSPFTDVPVNGQFYREIAWLAAQGISTGWPDGSFRPLQPVARDAMAAFLYRYNN